MDIVTEKKMNYKHLLSYDELSFEGIEYGLTDLYYDIKDDTLLIVKTCRWNNSTDEMSLPIVNKNDSLNKILDDFLHYIMTTSRFFIGTPQYENSDVYTKETFDNFWKRSIELMKEEVKLRILHNADNELINYCMSKNLYPDPVPKTMNNWYANCPSKRPHRMMISTESNEWGCGYCKMKGDLDALKNWVEELG